MESIANKKVCVIHDWLTTYAGAERVLEQVLNIFPDLHFFLLDFFFLLIFDGIYYILI